MKKTKTQETLIQLVKKKGIGKTMGKHLSNEELNHLNDLLASSEGHLTTKATLLTAINILPQTEEEEDWLNKNTPHIPKECQFLWTKKTTIEFEKIILKIQTQKSLSKKDIDLGLNALINPKIADYLKAMFLESLRLREESPLENKETLNFFQKHTLKKTINTPILITLANPYDGFNRFPNLSPFIAAILGQLGFPTLLHGSANCPPKYAVTPEDILSKTNIPTHLNLEETKKRLENKAQGWAYIDQKEFCTPLFQLKKIRQKMVKRPLLSTIEKFLCPFTAKKNYISTGFTHPPYRQKSIALLDEILELNGYLITRGSEGSAQMAIDRQSPLIVKINQTLTETFIKPEKMNLTSVKKQNPNPNLTAEETLQMALDALKSKNKIIKAIMVYNILTIINSLKLMPLAKAHKAIENIFITDTIIKQFIKQ